MSQKFVDVLKRAERTIEVVVAESIASAPDLFGWFMERIFDARGLKPDFGDADVEIGADRTSQSHGCGLRARTNFEGISYEMLVSVLFRVDTRTARAAEKAALAVHDQGGGRTPRTVLLAPQEIIEQVPAFTRAYMSLISIESFRGALAAAMMRRGDELGYRLTFQIGLVDQAIEAAYEALRHLTGVDPAFRAKWLDFLAEHVATLPTGDARSQTAEASDLVVFDIVALPQWPSMPRTRLVHFMRRGAAAIQIEGWGDKLGKLSEVMEPAMRRTTFRLMATRSKNRSDLLIVADAQILDPDLAFEDQTNAAIRSANALTELQCWYKSRQSATRYWAEYAGEEATGEGQLLQL
jgi:hypothetical protein